MPAIAAAAVAILHWPHLRTLLSDAPAPNFGLELKHSPLPGWYLSAVLLGVVLLGLLPYGEELLRTIKARAVAAKENGPPKRAVP